MSNSSKNENNPTIVGELMPRRGPKSKYKEIYCDKIKDIASRGGHIPAMMLAIGVGSKETWHRWQKEYPEFKEAVQEAEIYSQAFYEELGLKGLTGKIPNFNASTYALVMNNKFKGDYMRNPSNSEINITNNTVNLSVDELKKKLAQKAEKLKLMNVSDFVEFDPLIK